MRLRFLADVNPPVPEIDRLEGDELVTFVPLEDVWPGRDWQPTQTRPKAVVEQGYTRFREGDVLLPKIHPTFQADRSTLATGLLNGLGVGTTELHVIRPRAGTDARYISYLLSTKPFLEIGEAEMIGVAGQKRIPTDFILDYNVPIEDLRNQRAIADYLDTETARIDALIAKKEALEALVEQRTRAFISDVTSGTVERDDDWRSVRLRYAVDAIVDSEHSTAPRVDGADYLVVRTANVKEGHLTTDGAIYTDAESYRRWTRRARPEPGDVLFTREAPAGESCLVPSSPRVCLGQRMVLFKVDQDVMRGSWLLHSLYSGPAQRFIQLLSQGSTVAHLNMSDIRDIPLLLPPLKQQDRWLAQIDEQVAWSRTVREKLERQVVLLTEHRQALITAAVTGESEVPGVAA